MDEQKLIKSILAAGELLDAQAVPKHGRELHIGRQTYDQLQQELEQEHISKLFGCKVVIVE